MKTPFMTKEQLEAVAAQYPTPFHIYDEKGIRENARRFIDFALGEDVQRFLARVCQRRPVLGDAQEELRLIDYDLDWAARAREDVLAWWREMEAAQ